MLPSLLSVFHFPYCYTFNCRFCHCGQLQGIGYPARCRRLFGWWSFPKGNVVGYVFALLFVLHGLLVSVRYLILLLSFAAWVYWHYQVCGGQEKLLSIVGMGWIGETLQGCFRRAAESFWWMSEKHTTSKGISCAFSCLTSASKLAVFLFCVNYP